MASVNHGNIKGRKHTKEQKYVRGETHFDDDSDDIILDQNFRQQFGSHRKTNKYPSHRTKPKKYKKGVVSYLNLATRPHILDHQKMK